MRGHEGQWRHQGVDMSTPLLLEVAPEIDTNPTSFYRGRGTGGRSGRLRPQTPVIGSRSPCLSTPHILTWRRPWRRWHLSCSNESTQRFDWNKTSSIFLADKRCCSFSTNVRICSAQLHTTLHFTYFIYWSMSDSGHVGCEIVLDISALTLTYTVSQKETRHQTFAITSQMSTDFQNSFTGRLTGKFATNQISLFHHTLNMSLHYLVKYECQKTGCNQKYVLWLMINHKVV